jgi:hypothetical protein
MRSLFLSGNESTWLVTYIYCGYRMCRQIVASDEKGAEAELRRSLNIDRIVNVDKCVA